MSAERPHQSIEGDNNLQVGGDLHVTLPAVRVPQPVYVVQVIRKLDEVLEQPEQRRREYGKPAEVEEKLSFNHVNGFREFILEYGTYGHAVEGAYRSLGNSDPSIVRRVTAFIRSLYYDIAAESPVPSSDVILRRLIDILRSRVGQVPDVPAEQVDPCCNMLVAHAFVNCTILKHPNQVHVDC